MFRSGGGWRESSPQDKRQVGNASPALPERNSLGTCGSQLQMLHLPCWQLSHTLSKSPAAVRLCCQTDRDRLYCLAGGGRLSLLSQLTFNPTEGAFVRAKSKILQLPQWQLSPQGTFPVNLPHLPSTAAGPIVAWQAEGNPTHKESQQKSLTEHKGNAEASCELLLTEIHLCQQTGKKATHQQKLRLNHKRESGTISRVFSFSHHRLLSSQIHYCLD